MVTSYCASINHKPSDTNLHSKLSRATYLSASLGKQNGQSLLVNNIHHSGSAITSARNHIIISYNWNAEVGQLECLDDNLHAS